MPFFRLRLGRFMIELRPGFYVRVPGLGAAHYSRDLGLTCDPWSEVRRELER